MKTIHKYEIATADRQTVSIPRGASILKVALDPVGHLCLWAAVDPDARHDLVEIIIVGTGRPLPHVGSYIGSVVHNSFVWHVFTGPGHSSNRITEFHYHTAGNK